ncbi:MAG: DUF4115 domain-containing protein [Candidatus Omnitrophica bacterium]|jgi:transcriptional regulator with XRE-family HTH domain|nr:DUF4115 domain-containing protein [Candidatus Omnitrophota bacterium]
MTKETVGARLKKLRLEKGFSLEEVQKKTKIHPSILKAIEEDSLINLNPVYVKGFLKIYCRLLGADPRNIIPDYREIKTEVQLKPKAAVGKVARFSLPRINLKIVFIILGAIMAVFLTVGLIKLIAHQLKNKVPVPIARKTQVSSEIFSKARAPSSSGIRLGIRAKDKCYVSLKVDGRTVFQGELKKGRFESWQAKDKIEFALGNAGVVDLEVNGKLISNLGKKGQALRNVVVTRDGLSIKK